MKRKLLIGLLVLILPVLPLCAVACEEETLTEPIELSFSTHLPPVAARMAAYNEWAEKIYEETDGMVTVTIYPAGTLVGTDDMIDGVKSGLTDIGELTLGGDVDLFPLNNILNLPFLGLGETEEAYDIWMTLRDEFPEMEEELEDFKIVFGSGSGSECFGLHTTDREVVAPEDVQGLTISCEGGMVTVMDNLDAAPIIASAQEWASNLQTGVQDAMVMNWMAVNEMGLFDYLNYHTVFPTAGTNFGQMQMLMNWDSWNNLPGYVQDIIDDLRPWMEARCFECDAQANADGLTNAQTLEGHTIITLTPEQEDLWYQAALQVHLDYLAEYDAMGLPATEIYERALELAGQ